MTRILVLEEDDARFAAFEALAVGAGYQAVPADGAKRLVLEIRAAPLQLIVASADVSNGNGLDLVRDAYRELEAPLPVVACSVRSSASEVLQLAPRSLYLAAVLAPDPSPEEVLKAVLLIAPPADAEAAERLTAERLNRDAAQAPSVPLEGVVQLNAFGAEELLVAIEQQGWGGAVNYQPAEPTSAALICHFVEGKLGDIHSDGGGDLIQTARVQGRLDGITLPEVTLSSADEEVGLLMAMRALGTHEVEQLKAASESRLIGVLLGAKQGTVSFEPGLGGAATGSPPRALLPLLLAHRRDSGDQPLAMAAPESLLTVCLGGSGAHRGLMGLDRELVQQLSSAASRSTRFGSFLDDFARGNDERKVHAHRCLAHLRELGYVDYAETLFAADVSARLLEMVTELHRWSRSSHFEVLGVERDASDRVVRDGMRKLSLLYHPDRLVDAHPRVQELAELMYAWVQEVFAAVETSDGRAEYRTRLRGEESGEGATSRDQSSAKVAMAQASILVRRKRYTDAAELYRDATLHDSSNAEAYMWLGWCRYLGDRGDLEAAVSDLQRALELNRRLIDALFYLGRVHLLEKNYEKAREYFKRAAEAPSGHAQSASELRLMASRGLGLSAEEESERAAKADAKSGGKGLFSRFRRG